MIPNSRKLRNLKLIRRLRRGGVGRACMLTTSTSDKDDKKGFGKGVSGIKGIPGREEMLRKMSEEEFDVLVIGGGATGAGVALDAVTRGLKVAMVEREDFGSGTSSRSTKLLWAGIRYLAAAFAGLFQKKMLTSPKNTLIGFYETFKMVLGCQRERNHLLKTAPHLTDWVALVVPIDRWFIWPPPMKCPPAAFGPMGVYWIFFKFYDLLAKFACPPSHKLSKSSLQRCFPQLSDNLLFGMVFYEGTHDDSRTNIAIALSAAEHGACISNHTEVLELLTEGEGSQIVNGALVKDKITNTTFTIRAKSVIMCGGPFTDRLRKLEDEKSENVVNGAAGTHVVLSGKYCPRNYGMVDMATSDGRILFYLPWQGHTLVGTTDVPCDVSDRPVPTEEEIKWIITEANNYLSPECTIKRNDVLSAWSGIRPLAADPHADPNGPVSRDHIVSVNPDTKTIFVAGGKWTTYREMAEDAIDKLLEVHPSVAKSAGTCKTLSVPLLGAQGYNRNLDLQLAKNHNLSPHVSSRLAKCYGGRAEEVLEFHSNEGGGGLLIEGFPYIKAEVIYACREYARTVEDVLSRRTRLSYLNKLAAKTAVPVIADIMAGELGWTADEKKVQIEQAFVFLETFSGPDAEESS